MSIARAPGQKQEHGGLDRWCTERSSQSIDKGILLSVGDFDATPKNHKETYQFAEVMSIHVFTGCLFTGERKHGARKGMDLGDREKSQSPNKPNGSANLLLHCYGQIFNEDRVKVRNGSPIRLF